MVFWKRFGLGEFTDTPEESFDSNDVLFQPEMAFWKRFDLGEITDDTPMGKEVSESKYLLFAAETAF